MADLPQDDVVAELLRLVHESRPMMEDKCCHFEWCVERRGVVSDQQSEGFREIEDGMHPGCAPYRRWLERLDASIGGGA